MKSKVVIKKTNKRTNCLGCSKKTIVYNIFLGYSTANDEFDGYVILQVCRGCLKALRNELIDINERSIV